MYMYLTIHAPLHYLNYLFRPSYCEAVLSSNTKKESTSKLLRYTGRIPVLTRELGNSNAQRSAKAKQRKWQSQQPTVPSTLASKTKSS